MSPHTTPNGADGDVDADAAPPPPKGPEPADIAAEAIGQLFHAAVADTAGREAAMEDAHAVCNGDRLGCAFAVFDGFGGGRCSEQLARAFKDRYAEGLRPRCSQGIVDLCEALDAAYFTAVRPKRATSASPPRGLMTRPTWVDRDVQQTVDNERDEGAAGAVCLIVPGSDDGSTGAAAECYRAAIGLVGDARVVIHHKEAKEAEAEAEADDDEDDATAAAEGTTRVHVSSHSTANEDEVARIRSAGGWVSGGRVEGALRMTRSFGAEYFKTRRPAAEAFETETIVTATPDVIHETLLVGDVVLIASGGVFEKLTAEEAMTVVTRHLADTPDDFGGAAKLLCDTAVQDHGAKRNCTAMVVAMRPLPPQRRPQSPAGAVSSVRAAGGGGSGDSPTSPRSCSCSPPRLARQAGSGGDSAAASPARFNASASSSHVPSTPPTPGLNSSTASLGAVVSSPPACVDIVNMYAVHEPDFGFDVAFPNAASEFEVLAVRQGGPAWVAGIRKGMHVLTLNTALYQSKVGFDRALKKIAEEGDGVATMVVRAQPQTWCKARRQQVREKRVALMSPSRGTDRFAANSPYSPSAKQARARKPARGQWGYFETPPRTMTPRGGSYTSQSPLSAHRLSAYAEAHLSMSGGRRSVSPSPTSERNALTRHCVRSVTAEIVQSPPYTRSGGSPSVLSAKQSYVSVHGNARRKPLSRSPATPKRAMSTQEAEVTMIFKKRL